jgi:hypothetical protein
MKTTVLAVIIALVAGFATAADQPAPRVAFFGFQLINTSLQSTTPEEGQRIRMLDDIFRRKLNDSGRYELILRSLGLGQYESAFRENSIDFTVLSDLTDQDLEKLGVLLGHRRKLLRSIANRESTRRVVDRPWARVEGRRGRPRDGDEPR